MTTKSSYKIKKCLCDNPQCAKCPSITCQDDGCVIHTMARKIRREKSRRVVPTYTQILSMNFRNFKYWIWKRAKRKNIKLLIKEMAEHETKTNTFNKMAHEIVEPFRKALLLMFRKETSERASKVLDGVDKIYRKNGLKTNNLSWFGVMAKASNDLILVKKER